MGSQRRTEKPEVEHGRKNAVSDLENIGGRGSAYVQTAVDQV